MKKLLSTIYDGRVLFALSVLNDIVFLMIFVYVFSKIEMKLMEYLYQLVQIAETDLSALGSGSEIMQMLALNSGFAYSMGKVVQLLMILMLCVLLVYSIFQSFSWMLCAKITDPKWKGGLAYIGKFFVLSTVWIGVLYGFFYTWVRIAIYSIMSLVPAAAQWFATIMLIITSIALAYFAITSYVFIRREGILRAFQKTFTAGIRKWKPIGKTYLISFAVLVIGVTLGILTMRNFLLFLAYFGIIFVPMLSVIRIYLFRNIETT